MQTSKKTEKKEKKDKREWKQGVGEGVRDNWSLNKNVVDKNIAAVASCGNRI